MAFLNRAVPLWLVIVLGVWNFHYLAADCIEIAARDIWVRPEVEFHGRDGLGPAPNQNSTVSTEVSFSFP